MINLFDIKKVDNLDNSYYYHYYQQKTLTK